MKKIIVIIIGIILIITLVYTFLYFVNNSNIEQGKDPIFYFSKKEVNDGGSIEYNVLLYKIFKYKNVYNENVLYEIGTPTLKYKNPFYTKGSKYFIELK